MTELLSTIPDISFESSNYEWNLGYRSFYRKLTSIRLKDVFNKLEDTKLDTLLPIGLVKLCIGKGLFPNSSTFESLAFHPEHVHQPLKIYKHLKSIAPSSIFVPILDEEIRTSIIYLTSIKGLTSFLSHLSTSMLFIDDNSIATLPSATKRYCLLRALETNDHDLFILLKNYCVKCLDSSGPCQQKAGSCQQKAGRLSQENSSGGLITQVDEKKSSNTSQESIACIKRQKIINNTGSDNMVKDNDEEKKEVAVILPHNDSITSLPVAILCHIFNFLELETTIHNCYLVNRKWRYIASLGSSYSHCFISVDNICRYQEIGTLVQSFYNYLPSLTMYKCDELTTHLLSLFFNQQSKHRLINLNLTLMTQIDLLRLASLTALQTLTLEYSNSDESTPRSIFHLSHLEIHPSLQKITLKNICLQVSSTDSRIILSSKIQSLNITNCIIYCQDTRVEYKLIYDATKATQLKYCCLLDHHIVGLSAHHLDLETLIVHGLAESKLYPTKLLETFIIDSPLDLDQLFPVLPESNEDVNDEDNKQRLSHAKMDHFEVAVVDIKYSHQLCKHLVISDIQSWYRLELGNYGRLFPSFTLVSNSVFQQMKNDELVGGKGNDAYGYLIFTGDTIVLSSISLTKEYYSGHYRVPILIKDPNLCALMHHQEKVNRTNKDKYQEWIGPIEYGIVLLTMNEERRTNGQTGCQIECKTLDNLPERVTAYQIYQVIRPRLLNKEIWSEDEEDDDEDDDEVDSSSDDSDND